VPNNVGNTAVSSAQSINEFFIGQMMKRFIEREVRSPRRGDEEDNRRWHRSSAKLPGHFEGNHGPHTVPVEGVWWHDNLCKITCEPIDQWSHASKGRLSKAPLATRQRQRNELTLL